MLDRIEETIANYSMLSRGDRVGVAVSGGADSVALLEALRQLARRYNWTLVVLHLNHGLRGEESDADQAFVENLARTDGLEIHCERANLDPASGVEEAGRQARLSFFAAARRAWQLSRVATGHTRSDQAETVLFRLLRGAGPAGLSAILPVTAEGLIRPLLEIDRQDLEDWLRGQGRAWREDLSNHDPRFARNRIRHDLLPQLSRDWNPRLSETLAGAARIALDEEIYWSTVVDEAAARVLRPAGRNALIADLTLLRQQPAAVQRRLIRRAAGGLDFGAVERIHRLCLAPEGDGRIVLASVDVMRSFDWVRFAPPSEGPVQRNWSVAVDRPGRYAAPNGSCAVEILRCPASGAVFRAWRPGDAFEGTSLKHFFQKWRIPLWERRDWPVVVCGETLLWARGLPAAPVLTLEEVGFPL